MAISTPHPPALTGERWRARRFSAWALRAAIFLAPMVAAIAASLWLSGSLFEAKSAPAIVAWWAILIAFSSLVAWGVDRLARKLVPLTVMLKATMLFPDRAPSRYRVALRRSNVAELRRRIAEHDGDLSASAELILSLGQALNEHDRRTRGHGERTRAYTDMLAEELKIPEVDRDKLRWAALLHDIGKLEVPAEILNKDGPLDAEELALIRRHPLMGMRVAAAIVPWLGEWAGAIEHHHEWWDGTGYPRGLKGTEISMAARIVSVADAFDVMTSGRSYQAAKSPEAARQEVARMAGSQFDPTVARALMNVSLGRLRWAIGPVTWLGQIPFYLDRLGRDFITVSTAATVTAAAMVGGFVDLPVRALDPAPITAEAVGAAPDSIGGDDLANPSDSSGVASGAADTEGDSATATDTSSTTSTPEATTIPTTTSGTIPGTTPGTIPGTTPPTTVPGTTPPTQPPDPPGTAPPTTSPATPPTVNPDIASTNEDETVTIAVLANDEAGLTLSTITSQPGAGQARISGSSIVFAPSRNATGTETMGYRACKSGNLCSETTVAIRINPVNDAPVASPDTATTNWGTSVTIPVLANDTDVDGDALRVTDVDLAGPGAATTNGTTVTYAAPIDFAGSVVIDYTACDPTGSCSSATVAVTVVAVARPPLARDDTATTNGQSGRVKRINVLANDSDPDGDLDPATLSISQQPAHGKATLNQGQIDYAATAGFHGTDSFTYRICDATDLCDTAVVRVTVP